MNTEGIARSRTGSGRLWKAFPMLIIFALGICVVFCLHLLHGVQQERDACIVWWRMVDAVRNGEAETARSCLAEKQRWESLTDQDLLEQWQGTIKHGSLPIRISSGPRRGWVLILTQLDYESEDGFCGFGVRLKRIGDDMKIVRETIVVAAD